LPFACIGSAILVAGGQRNYPPAQMRRRKGMEKKDVLNLAA